MKVVIDTNVLVSALRSKNDASHEVVKRAFLRDFQVALSLPLYLEYLAVLTRPELVSAPAGEAEAFCRDIAAISTHHRIHFLWRPMLPDANDDLVLELAIASSSSHIVTHNLGDFRPSLAFKVKAIRPADFLLLL